MAQSYTAVLSIYAELLSNIRQVSVRATLSSSSDSTTKAEILDDGRRIHVHHRGEVRSLDLPARVSVRSAISIPEKSSPDLAWRLPVPATETGLPRFSAENQSVPWSSTDIKTGSRVCCRHCDHVIVQPERIKSWKDLPSENWAEMMEFWHCHKPHEHEHEHHDGEALSKRGYGADSSITAQPEIGFVDLTSFMFSESDCDGLLVSLDFSPPYLYAVLVRDDGEREGGLAERIHTSQWPGHRYNSPKRMQCFFLLDCGQL